MFRNAATISLWLFGAGFVTSAQTTPANSSYTASGPFAPMFQHYVDNSQISGAVFLVATIDKVLDEEAIGYGNLETHRPMKTNDLFWIASMTKPFTSTALMMLVDEGKLSVDDPVEKYLPEFKGMQVQTAEGLVPASHPILIKELLSHTGGMANLPDDYAQPLAGRVKKFSQAPLENQPGTTFKYVNAGIDSAGRVIEVVSGEPYEQFIQDRILTPLGMTETTFWPSDALRARLATSYQATAKGDALQPAEIPMAVKNGGKPAAFPAGGLFSTADDLLKFCRMLLNGGAYNGRRYISQASIDLMTRRVTTEKTGGSYALGWMVSSNSFFHDGAFITRMSIEPLNGIVEVFLVQLSKPYKDHGDNIRKEFTTAADKFYAQPQPSPTLPPSSH